jgi:hypothetical protein
MYTTVRNTPADAIAAPRTGRRRVASTVLLLGLVSLITDLSQEMVVAVLPLYLVFQAGLTPLQLGLVDGLYQGVTAVLRLVGGLVADRRGRYKEVAVAGYGASAVCKLGLIAAGGAWAPRSPTSCWPSRWGAWPTGSAAAACSWVGTRH